jgi:hypothetical protein
VTLKVTVKDLETHEEETAEVPDGDYLLIVYGPLLPRSHERVRERDACPGR